MDLRNNKISIDEILKYPRAKGILERSFPILTNPFLFQVARKMSLENTLKLANGSYAQEIRDKVVLALEAL